MKKEWAYTTVQTLASRLERKGALRKVKKIGNAQLFEPAIDQHEFRDGLVRDLLELFGGSPRLLVSNLLESGRLTLRDMRAIQNAVPSGKSSHGRVGRDHDSLTQQRQPRRTGVHARRSGVIRAAYEPATKPSSVRG